MWIVFPQFPANQLLAVGFSHPAVSKKAKNVYNIQVSDFIMWMLLTLFFNA